MLPKMYPCVFALLIDPPKFCKTVLPLVDVACVPQVEMSYVSL